MPKTPKKPVSKRKKVVRYDWPTIKKAVKAVRNLISLHDKELAGKIERLKAKTRQETGAFKYDECYDEVLALLNQKP